MGIHMNKTYPASPPPLHTHTHTQNYVTATQTVTFGLTSMPIKYTYICLPANMYVQAVLLHFAVGPSHMSQTLIYILLQITLSLSLSLSLSHTHTHTHTH